MSRDIPTLEIQDRIRAAMGAAGMTIAAFAERVGTTQQRVKDVLRGKQRVPADMLETLASMDGVDIQYVLTGHHADRLQHERAYIERLNAAGVVVDNVFSSYLVVPVPMLREAMKGAVADGLEQKHVDNITRGVVEQVAATRERAPKVKPERVRKSVAKMKGAKGVDL